MGDNDYPDKPLEPGENQGVRAVLDERKFRKRVWVIIGKLSTFLPWLIGGLALMKGGDFMGALEWWK